MAPARRLRVAFVCGNLAPAYDGVADYSLRLAEALRDSADVETVLVAPGTDPADPATASAARVAETVPMAKTWGGPGLLAVSSTLRRLRPDVVHVQFAPSAYGFSPAPGLLPVLAGRAVPWVTTLHEYGWWSWPPRLPPAAWRPWERRSRWDRETLRLVPRSEAVVVTNSDHAETVRARFGREAVTIPVPPNVPAPKDGADSTGQEHARAWLRARLGLAPDSQVAVFFGFVHPVKGVRYLLEALGLLRADFPDLHLAVVGGFTSLALPHADAAAFRRKLEEHARGLGVRERVSFTGHLPAGEVSAALAGADLCVLPFTAGVTTKSGALTAALAHGLPTVVTAADPPDPALVDGRTAVVVSGVRDPVPVATGICRILGDPALRVMLAAGGRSLTAERRWPVVAARHWQLYQRLLAPTTPTAAATAAPTRSRRRGWPPPPPERG